MTFWEFCHAHPFLVGIVAFFAFSAVDSVAKAFRGKPPNLKLGKPDATCAGTCDGPTGKDGAA